MPDKLNATNGQLKDSLVAGKTSQGAEISAPLLKVTRYSVVFEMYNPGAVLRFSEVLQDFKITVAGNLLYSGKAVVRGLIHTGAAVVVCEATLNEASWVDVSLAASNGHLRKRLGEEYRDFFAEWQKIYKVLPEFKVVIADMQIFLADLRLWLDQIDIGIRALPGQDRGKIEQEMVRQLGESIVPTFDVMHERLESVAASVEEDLRPVHQSFSKRQLHPLVLCSPFAHRTFSKPLGYAGDYEMVNMIARDPFEGDSLYAKIVNLWFLSQWPARAHRNRLKYLTSRLQSEALLGMSLHRDKTRVLNFACGPAVETQQFFRESPLSDHVELTLVDFNKETLDYAASTLNSIKNQFGRRTDVRLLKKSVHQVLKDGHKPAVAGNGGRQEYDLIYCAGLFDYLSDRTCKQMMEIFYGQLAPGGLLVTTTVDDYKPFRHMLEFILDWHLIYRDAKKVANLFPDGVTADQTRLVKDDTGVNVFIEVRKPHA